MTDEDLSSLFTQYGSVSSAKILKDKMNGRSKGFGFVEMTSDSEAATAIEKYNGADYEGRAMTVNEAKPMAPRTEGSRGGGYNSRGSY